MHIRRPRAMRASVGRAGCALAAARARASVALAAHWLVAAAAPLRARASVALAAHWQLPRDARASVTLAAHACCAPYERARERALRREVWQRSSCARCVHASEVGEEDDSNNDGERTCERRAYHHDGPATAAARSPSTRPTSAHESKKDSVRGMLKPHTQAARSSRTLKPHAQAARSSTAFARQLAAPFWRTTRIVAADRWLPSVRERQKHAEVRSNPIWPARSNRVRQVPRDVLSMRLIW